MKVKTLFLTTALLTAPAFAAGTGKQKQQEETSKQKAMDKERKQRQVEGTILQHKTVRVAPKGQADKGKATAENLVVQIKTSKGNERLVVDLGSMKAAPEIKDGQTRLRAQGRMVKIGKQEFMVARKAQINGQEFSIQRPMMKQAQEEKKKRQKQSK